MNVRIMGPQIEYNPSESDDKEMLNEKDPLLVSENPNLNRNQNRVKIYGDSLLDIYEVMYSDPWWRNSCCILIKIAH
jgi:hypothetical protein